MFYSTNRPPLFDKMVIFADKRKRQKKSVGQRHLPSDGFLISQTYTLAQSRESHKCEGEDAGGDECDRNAFHRLGHFGEFQLFAQARKDYERKSVAEGVGKGKYCRFCRTVGGFAYCKYRYTKHCTVGGDKGKKDAERLI